MAEPPALPTRPHTSKLNQLTKAECWWRDHQGWLAERGYMLRPRYRPGWEPSWHIKVNLIEFNHEDWHCSEVCTSPCSRAEILIAKSIGSVRVGCCSHRGQQLGDVEAGQEELAPGGGHLTSISSVQAPSIRLPESHRTAVGGFTRTGRRGHRYPCHAVVT